jgi:hypothetical protein
MSVQQNNPDYVTTIGMGVLAFVGAVSKGNQWRDGKTGKISLSLLFTGVSTALLLTAIVRAIGIHYGMEVWAQIALAGVFGYIGPDPIISVISSLVLKWLGLGDQSNGGRDDGPKQ